MNSDLREQEYPQTTIDETKMNKLIPVFLPRSSLDPRPHPALP
jgi:hypothetical protein